MALTTKRIIALPSQTDPQEGDYLAIDNAQGGTHKIPVGRIGVEVDDTLTEAGKAADAKATGDALDEIRSQIEVTGTASGAIATFTDGAEMPAKSVVVNIEPQQSGTGTPSPDNVRQISGWTEVNVIVSPTEDEADATTTTVNLGRTVYGGTLDVVSGQMVIDRGIVDLGSCSWWYTSAQDCFYTYTVRDDTKSAPSLICSAYPYVGIYADLVDKSCAHIYNNAICVRDSSYNQDATAFKTAMSGVQLVYELANPQTIQLTPEEVNTLLGENNVWADSGDVEVVYVRDLNITINNLLNSNGTRSLGMMAMSAPTEDTAEEQNDEHSDEPTEEPAEDDMR